MSTEGPFYLPGAASYVVPDPDLGVDAVFVRGVRPSSSLRHVDDKRRLGYYIQASGTRTGPGLPPFTPKLEYASGSDVRRFRGAIQHMT